MSSSSVWPIDRTLSGTTILAQSGPESNGNEDVFRIPKALALLEPHHQWVNFISWTLVVGVLPFRREPVGVFNSHSRLGLRTLVGRVLPLRREPVGVFNSHSRLGLRTLVGRVLPLCRDAVGVFNSHSRLGLRTLVGRVLPLCRDAVGVFNSHSQLGLRTLVGRVLPLCRYAVDVWSLFNDISNFVGYLMLNLRRITMA